MKALEVVKCRILFSSYLHPTYIIPLEISSHYKDTLSCCCFLSKEKELIYFSYVVTDHSLMKRTVTSKLSNLMLKDVCCPCKRICHPFTGCDSMVLIKLKLQEQIDVIRKVPFCSHMNTEFPLCLWAKQFTTQLFAFFAIATLFSCDQCNRPSKCLPSVTTQETRGTFFLSMKQETQWLWPMSLMICHSEEETTPRSKFCNSRKLLFHLYLKPVWLQLDVKRKKKTSEERYWPQRT